MHPRYHLIVVKDRGRKIQDGNEDAFRENSENSNEDGTKPEKKINDHNKTFEKEDITMKIKKNLT